MWRVYNHLVMESQMLPASSDAASKPRKKFSFLDLSKPAYRWDFLLVLLAAVIILEENIILPAVFYDRLQTFVTIFLSIFIEAVPFLLAGSVVAGFIEVFVKRDTLIRFVPRHPVGAALAGGALGMVFPVCECGVVPVTRRLFHKGLPLSVGVAFLLAAPVVNPIVVASTYAAYGWGPMLWLRLGLSFMIASMVGLIFYFATPDEVMLPDTLHAHSSAHHHHHDHSHNNSVFQRIWDALATGGDDFLDMARYLVAGCLLAAGMQTLVPQSALLLLGAGVLTSILVMMALAFVLSVCSTVDAFLSLAFVSTFTPASILAFLVFGPMVDIKSSLMFLSIFRRRVVGYLILLPFMFTLVITLFLNLYMRW
jgi:uncharacterized membrane protein YraQ (UPF0718 family)